MGVNLRAPQSHDVSKDHELLAYLDAYRKLFNWVSHEMAVMAAETSAMLKDADKKNPNKDKKGRARRVARPLAFTAGVLILASKYMAVCARRFRTEYDEEINASRHRTRRGPRTMHFGD